MNIRVRGADNSRGCVNLPHNGYDCKEYSDSAGEAVGESITAVPSESQSCFRFGNGRLAVLGRSTV